MADENTQQQQEPTEAQLAEMAASLDATGEVDIPAEATPETEATPAPDAAPKTDEGAPEGADKSKKTEPSDKDKGPGPEAADKQPKDQQQQEQPESAYHKAKKELERQDRSWKKLEEEKAALRKEREELDSKRAQAEAPRDSSGYTVADYEDAAKKFDASGDATLAAKARAKAQELRQTAQTTQVEAQQRQRQTDWNKTISEVVEEKPELKDVNSPLGKKVAEALKANPHFAYVPDGFRRAVEHVELQDKSALVPGLQTENETLKKEIERLNKLTSVGGSGPASKPVTKSFDDMTAAEREAELTRQAEAADQQAA